MHLRFSYLITWIDRALGAFLSVVLVAAGFAFFALGGAPKGYEITALGGAYASMLSNVEQSARALHDEYCARTGAAPAEANCASHAP